mmetsp:Transcript_7952/g.26020  ORF Transcript_7952/g.26020 Transcript_7952/m.26020 type:complete len:250 (+) Transcript_7952:906-1655(+)
MGQSAWARSARLARTTDHANSRASAARASAASSGTLALFAAGSALCKRVPSSEVTAVSEKHRDFCENKSPHSAESNSASTRVRLSGLTAADAGPPPLNPSNASSARQSAARLDQSAPLCAISSSRGGAVFDTAARVQCALHRCANELGASVRPSSEQMSSIRVHVAGSIRESPTSRRRSTTRAQPASRHRSAPWTASFNPSRTAETCRASASDASSSNPDKACTGRCCKRWSKRAWNGRCRSKYTHTAA